MKHCDIDNRYVYSCDEYMTTDLNRMHNGLTLGLKWKDGRITVTKSGRTVFPFDVFILKHEPRPTENTMRALAMLAEEMFDIGVDCGKSDKAEEIKKALNVKEYF